MKKEIKIGNKILRITNMDGDSSLNPRNKDFDEGQLGTMICWHSRYNMGDEQMNSDPLEWIAEMLDTDVEIFCSDNNIEYEYNSTLKKALAEAFMERYVALPIFLYDHSGQTVSTSPFSCSWDSGQVGWIYTTDERIKELGLDTDTEKYNKEWLLDNLRHEIKLYDQYLQGDIWMYELVEEKTCEHCNNTEEEHIDSCVGFFGTEWENNGITENLPEEFTKELLANPELD